ncbi:uncharacterized protein LOC126802959 [Argentina anserina]|uniref:uncharacterized protein LOC126802959 n=1 Tax=Argentina anserina TaxID=57926 RepID=UPI0021761E0E|nr:uncharacterized protein LOC126802959 [Potentilla anserina]
MFSLCSKRLQLLLPSRSISVNSVTYLHSSRNPLSYSSKSLLGSENDKPNQEDKGSSFTVSYLRNSFGMSPEIALHVSERVHFETRERPDSVIKLFRDYGLSDAQVQVLVKKLPRLLLRSPENLLPKLEFLVSIGLSGNDLAKALFSNPIMLTRSLEKCIIPSYHLIKSIVGEDHRVATFFRTSRWTVSGVFERNLVSNVAFLRGKLGVPESAISVYLTWHPFMMCRKPEGFKEDASKLMSMGIEPSSSSIFMKALVVTSMVDASKREQKMRVFKGWGWTEDDFMLAFRTNPLFMTLSENILSSKMDFLLNKMGWQPADVARNSYVLSYSLERRIIPTCSVIRVLLVKGLITKEGFSLVNILKKSEKCLLDNFVCKYQEQVPELLSIYQGKTGLAELGL